MHQIAMPFHFGTAGLVRGGAANDLLPISGEPNVTIMEAKALTCNIVPGRLPRGPASMNFSTNMHRKLGQRSCIQKSGLSEKRQSGGGHAMEGKE